MTTSNAAELLIRIGADPSGAEQRIGQFRTSFGSSLRGIIADMQAVQNSSLALQDTLVRGFLRFDFALARNTVNAIIWQKSIGAAFQKAAVTAVSAIAQEAIVRALYSTALGFYLLAIRDFSGAAQAFKSAAIFGAVGGAAALAGRALAGGAGGNSAGASAGQNPSSSAAGAPTAASAASSAQPSGTRVQVIFQGPIYGGQAGLDELMNHISQAVQQRDYSMQSYTGVRKTVTRA
jgi:hypothetical protein